ncbi:iron chaperone [Hyalangium gracile]|uniref:iron chaperone n=1 Tax=Hyalangium gracile TaxID=394092 RepID=UPI001CCB7B8E|nr:DUF1801 domain-containing protein [Hyalangium gracile]
MKTARAAPKTIDEYIAAFPPDVQEQLEKIRKTVRKAAPKAEEAIKYEMPAFLLEGNLVFFAAYKKHIGFFDTTTGDGALSDEMAPYAGPKGSLKFPYGEPIPFGLLSKIVKFRVKENLERAAARSKKKTK